MFIFFDFNVFVATAKLSATFVTSVLIIVLIGILISEIFKRRKIEKEIVYFFASFLFFLGKTFIDVYFLCYNKSLENVLGSSDMHLYLNIVPVLITMVVLFLLWKKLNKSLAYVVILSMAFIGVVSYLLLFYQNLLIEFICWISVGLFNVLFCFLVIKFLIDTSLKKE